MAVSEADIAHAVELFEGIGEITTRKMMGGVCLYADGVIFAIRMSDGVIKIKAQDPDFIARIEGMGAERWTYQRDTMKKPTAMPYWTLPDAVLEDADLALELAKETLTTLVHAPS